MKRQADLLRETDWNVLLILDACRWDAFDSVTPVDAQPVRSMAWCTRHWMPRFAQVLDGEPVLYVSANPVCERELITKAEHPNFTWLSIWRHGWGRHGQHNMPTVHPADVAVAVRGYLLAHGQPERMVVHFVQPHVPFIGTGALPYADWGHVEGCAFAPELQRTQHCRDALREGQVTAAELRQAYLGNFALVWRWVVTLIWGTLSGQVVVTADHGELLGDDGRYGHTYGARPELMTVPWWQPPVRHPLNSQPIAGHDAGTGPLGPDDAVMLERLKDLGYA